MSENKTPSQNQQESKQVIVESGRALPTTNLTIPMPPVKPPPPSKPNKK
jgi:hypothetical protein